MPKSGEDKPYREEQLEQLAARVHKDLRRMKQANPGSANYEFLNILQMCLDAKLKAEEDTEQSRKEVQEMSPEHRLARSKSVPLKHVYLRLIR